ncbi:MAG: GatB/YqeY domain-containing protein [Pseudomonadota bacterium]
MASDETPLNSNLRQQIEAALDSAEQADPGSVRAQTLRLLACAIRDRDVSARTRGQCAGCPEEAVEAVIRTMADQLRLSAQEYEDAGRIEEAERERDELEVIEAFLPSPLDQDALETAVRSVVAELNASKLKDAGRCMQALKSKFPGQIDPAHAGKLVRNTLLNPTAQPQG